MASYHCSVKILSRSAGRSSVQFSAYISAEKMKDDRLGQTFSHVSKEEVCYSDMIFSDRVEEEKRDPEIFWNDVEAVEKQSTSQVARTWEVALPHELSIEQNQELAKEFAQSLIKDGMPAVQYAVHQKEGNWHVHLMAPMRDYQNGCWQAKERKAYALDKDGKKIPLLDKDGMQKYRERKGKGKELLWERKTVKSNPWNSRDFIKIWRERVAILQNRALEKYGHDVRVDYRSYEDRGLERLPTIHEGYNARKMERIGVVSERCEHNREVERKNDLLQKIDMELQTLNEDKQRQKEERNHGRLEELLRRREHELLRRRNVNTRATPDRERTAPDRERTVQEKSGNAERLYKLFEQRKRDAERREQEAESKPASYSTASANDTRARETDTIIRATEQLAEKKQREAIEADRERQEAGTRKQQAEKGIRRRKRTEQDLERF